ncbi:MAG: serine/threonine-protein kinase [Vicinamibacteria bacterium]
MSDLTQTIGRYQISRELGRGMMGVVYLAHDPDLVRDIALKVIQLPHGSKESDRQSFEQRFFAEARSAARLSHPGIVVVHDVGRDTVSGAPFMALQFVPGRTLEMVIRDRTRLELTEAIFIARRVAEALHHAHSQGVVHRDVKPANIMILPSGEPMIMDFGIAKLEASRMTATGQFVGTPLYMSPEQAMVHPVDGRSDIFSLGSVLYEMLTGAPAFYGESITRILLQLIHHEPVAPSTVVTTIPAFVDHVLARSLAKDVHLRYQTAQEMADDLKDMQEGKAPRSMTSGSALEAILGTTASADTGPWVAGTLSGGLDLAEWGVETHPSPKPGNPAIESLVTPPPPAGNSRIIEVAVLAAVITLGAVLWLVSHLSVAAPPPHGQLAQVNPAPTPFPTPIPTSVPLAPAQLTVEFEHSLKVGTLKIFVDNEAVAQQAVGAKVARRIIGIPIWRGLATRTLGIVPGKHTIKVQVLWDDNTETREAQTTFKAGGRLRLKAKLGGRFRKDLSLEWN